MRRYTLIGDNRIGAILISYGLSRDDLQSALRFQLEHRGVRLGDICVRLGYSPEWVRDLAVAQQQAQRRGPMAMLRLASERTRALNMTLDWLQRLLAAKKGTDR
jgi:hypothetical protein